MGDTVEFEVLGQASVAVRVGEQEIVSDPWVLRKAQLGGWEAYPPRGTFDIEALRKRVDAATHIFLSHDHADHFDPEFLAQLAPKPPACAPGPTLTRAGRPRRCAGRLRCASCGSHWTARS